MVSCVKLSCNISPSALLLCQISLDNISKFLKYFVPKPSRIWRIFDGSELIMKNIKLIILWKWTGSQFLTIICWYSTMINSTTIYLLSINEVWMYSGILWGCFCYEILIVFGMALFVVVSALVFVESFWRFLVLSFCSFWSWPWCPGLSLSLPTSSTFICSLYHLLCVKFW